jgi:hypothetical protein
MKVVALIWFFLLVAVVGLRACLSQGAPEPSQESLRNLAQPERNLHMAPAMRLRD